MNEPLYIMCIRPLGIYNNAANYGSKRLVDDFSQHSYLLVIPFLPTIMAEVPLNTFQGCWNVG